ncbi:MAG: TlpA family protein disulfide reductase [Acidobacteriota bacterium]|nr:TlpA family protein disulfide reductase [Acidobacteriota bacterium]
MRSSIARILGGCALAALIAAAAAASGAAGPAPQFTLGTPAGVKESLSQFKGQVVMLNFWATWCGPCQQEMPLLDQMYKQYAPAGFTLLGISVDTDVAAVKKLLARKPVSFTVLVDPKNRVAGEYHVEEMPSTIIIDRKGDVRYVHRGYKPGDENEYQDLVRKLIQE